MRVLFYEQDYCGWCTRLKPVVKAATEKLGLEVEYIDITGKWEIATELGFKTTPAVYLDDDGLLTTIKSRTAVALIKELEQYVL